MITMTPFAGWILGTRPRMELVVHPIAAQRPVFDWLIADNSTGVSAGERRHR